VSAAFVARLGEFARLMMQLFNGQQHACVLVFVPMVDILNIPYDCQFVLSVLDELCFTRRLMPCVIL